MSSDIKAKTLYWAVFTPAVVPTGLDTTECSLTEFFSSSGLKYEFKVK